MPLILHPIKCKLCGKSINPPDAAKVIGQSEQIQNQAIIAKLLGHIRGMAEEEGKTPPQGPHFRALIEATLVSQNLHAALILGQFDLDQPMEADRQKVLKRVHAETRTVRMTDEELALIYGASEYCRPDGTLDSLAMLMDLRDRYEERGKYAPQSDAQTADTNSR